MAFCSVHFKAESIAKATSMNVIVPDGEGPFPVLYLLHGLSDDYSSWLRRTSIERYVEGMGLMVVMPDGHRSFYVNDPRPGGFAYEDHIVKDVVGFVDRTFSTVASRGGRAIAGLSMGGYGAMMLAMRHPDMFRTTCSHSGALGFTHSPVPDRPDLNPLIESLQADRYDCFTLAEKLAAGGSELAIRIDCGTEDFLLGQNREFHAHLERLGIEHVYEEYPGEHNWGHWDEHIRQTLAFVMEQMSN